MSDYAIIASRRHPTILAKESIWKMIELNYYGGEYYKNGGYLFQYPKESDGSFQKRIERSVLFNQLAPVVDLLVGFIFGQAVQRTNTEQIEFMVENASKGAGIDLFMRSVAKWSLMFTCGVLVDSPNFDPVDVQTELQREQAELNPYAVLYKPERIRDFSVDKLGNLIWVLLDNSYLDNSDPLVPDKEVVKYRLWTVTDWTDYIIDPGDGSGDGEITASDPVPHDVGYVPFKFVSWRDDDSDFIAESICEDLALINQSIFNDTSYMDEMLAGGTFKMLLWPSADGKAPTALTQGISELGIIPYPIEASKEPKFIGAELKEVTPFIESQEYKIKEFLKKVGMDNDEEKSFVKSGAARKLDFEKVKTILTGGAITLAATELWIYDTAMKWLGKENTAEVSYSTDFLNDDNIEKMAAYSEASLLPYDSTKKAAHKLMATLAFSDDISSEDMAEILKEIDEAELVEPDINAMVDEENQNNETEENEDDDS